MCQRDPSLVDRYHWRTPYTGMTEEEVVAHLQAARDFSFSDADPTDCITGTLQGGNGTCCLSWAGTKLETDYLFGDVDDTDGTIKVRGLAVEWLQPPFNRPDEASGRIYIHPPLRLPSHGERGFPVPKAGWGRGNTNCKSRS